MASDPGRQLHRAGFDRQSDRRAEGGRFRRGDRLLGLFQSGRAPDRYHARDRDAMAMDMTSSKSKHFNPISLDAINFLLADVRGALGPYQRVPRHPAALERSPKSDW